MPQNVAAYLLHRLQEWGTEHVFGYPGDGINGITAALGRMEAPPRFVQSRHEEMSALQAVGYAKFSGRLGVCLATGGPGAIHLLNGLYDAKLDHVPVLALVGQTARSAIGGSYQQEVDLHALFKDVAGAYLQTAMVPQQLPNLLDRAIRTALAQRCPTALIIPSDVQELEYSGPEQAFEHVPSSPPGLSPPTVTAPSEELDRAADVINSGRRVAILVGQGARGAAEEVAALAEATGGGVAKALLGLDVFSDDVPYVTGSIGLLGTHPSWELMRDCDTLVIVGSNLPYTQFLPGFGVRAVQIDTDAGRLGMRYPVEVGLVGDAAATLRDLLPRLEPTPLSSGRHSWRERIEESVVRWNRILEAQAQVPAEPINPMRIVHALARLLPGDATVTADSGSAANWYARFLRFRDGIRGSLSGTLATMGCAVPYAIGAKFADPHRPAVALVGDGAMQMNGLAELLTIRRHHHEWADPRLVVCVLHNNDLNQVTWEQRAMAGSPKTPFSQDLPDMSYAGFASQIGLLGIAVDTPEELVPAWHRALTAEQPVVLDVRCDPDIPPIPPHIEPEQIKGTAKGLLTGDPDAFAVLRKGVQTAVQEFRPSRAADSDGH